MFAVRNVEMCWNYFFVCFWEYFNSNPQHYRYSLVPVLHFTFELKCATLFLNLISSDCNFRNIYRYRVIKRYGTFCCMHKYRILSAGQLVCADSSLRQFFNFGCFLVLWTPQFFRFRVNESLCTWFCLPNFFFSWYST